MKKSFLDSLIIVFPLKFLSLILRVLPLKAALWTGRRLGAFVYHLNPKAKAVAYSNLKMAFSRKFEIREIRLITKEVFQNIGMNLAELFRFPSLDKKFVEKYVDTRGFEKIQKSLAEGRGIILLSAHFGNWELSVQVSALKGVPAMVLAAKQKHSRINELLNYYRALHGCKVITKGFGVKELLKALKEKKVIGILSDQDVKKHGVETVFFGRSAMTARGPFQMALRTAADIFPCFSVREKGGRHRLFIEDSLAVRNNTCSDDDVLKNQADKFNRLLEEKVSEFPSQWLWTLKRWKSGRHKGLVILSDGKAGHLNQAKFTARIITEELSKKGIEQVNYQNKQKEARVIEVKFKNNFLRVLFKAAAPLIIRRFGGSFKYLKLFLEKKAFLDIEKCYGDIFISAGSGLDAVNLILAAENQAKSVVVMKPFLPLAWFDMAVVPAHDLKGGLKGRPKSKTAVILGAAVSIDIDSEANKNRAEDLMNKLKLDKPDCVALFFGGDTAVFKYVREEIDRIIAAVKEAADELNVKILISTSRRTPPWLEDYLEETFKADKKCAFLVIANKNNIPEALPAMLALSKLVLVSGESVSMVSEAASTNRQVIVFLPAGGRGKRRNLAWSRLSKQERLLADLTSLGCVEQMRQDLKAQIIDLYSRGYKENILSNSERIKEAVKVLLGGQAAAYPGSNIKINPSKRIS